jgi:membrane protein YdbS with pleckstrin-like domain
MSLVLRTTIAAPGILFLTDKDNVIVAICGAVIIVVTSIFTLFEISLVRFSVIVHLFDFAFVVVIFVTAVAADKRPFLGDF